MYTTLFIVAMWLVAIGGMYVFMNIAFWLFAQLFGCIDSYIQNRY